MVDLKESCRKGYTYELFACVEIPDHDRLVLCARYDLGFVELKAHELVAVALQRVRVPVRVHVPELLSTTITSLSTSRARTRARARTHTHTHTQDSGKCRSSCRTLIVLSQEPDTILVSSNCTQRTEDLWPLSVCAHRIIAKSHTVRPSTKLVSLAPCGRIVGHFAAMAWLKERRVPLIVLSAAPDMILVLSNCRHPIYI